MSGRLLVAIAAAVLTAAAVAFADELAAPPDTDLTPTAKESPEWQRVEGARFGDSDVPAGSVTPFTADLFTVSYYNQDNGFAAGAVCRDDPPPGVGLKQFAETCARVPVIYRYTQPAGQPAKWEEIYRGPPENGAGFVGQIAWIGRGRALAVGGSGTYPRREQLPGEPDPAGAGRAWIYESDHWRELESGELPAGMLGMTALDCAPRKPEFCVAGASKQLWMWNEGRFTQGFSRTMNADKIEDAAGFRFRVRAIRFVPGDDTPGAGLTQVVALTAGCCDTTRFDNAARALLYDGQMWHVRMIEFDPQQDSLLRPAGAGQQVRDHAPGQTIPDSFYSLYINPSNQLSAIASPGPEPPDGPAGHEHTSAILGGMPLQEPVGGPNAHGTTVIYEALGLYLACVAVEVPCSDQNGDETGDVTAELLDTSTADIRLVSGDGDLTRPPPQQVAVGAQSGPDGVIDWAVGSLRANGQGVAVTTTLKGKRRVPSPLQCPTDAVTLNCQPSSDKLLAGLASKSVFALDSYALNSFAMVGTTGAGWAVGDRGAIWQLGESSAIAGAFKEEPKPPQLGSPAPGALPDGAPYDGFRPLPSTGEPGAVPALRARPLEHLAEPRLVPGGSPDPTRSRKSPVEDVGSMAMSRDGSEGWAVGAPDWLFADQGKTTTLYHYDGADWIRCDTEGIEGLVAPDPACASLDALRHYHLPGSNSPNPVELLSIARVPLENDSDPSNDDEFEAVALGTAYQEHPSDAVNTVILRYRDGRWQLDPSMRDIPGSIGGAYYKQIAFAAPDDGWIVGAADSLLHYDGTHWTDCRPPGNGAAGGCDDPIDGQHADGRVPSNNTNDGFQLAVTGGRVYLSRRRIGGDTVLGATAFPLILYHDYGKPCRQFDDPGCWRAADGGLDPGLDDPSAGSDQQGRIDSLAVAADGAGGFQGWATALIGGGPPATGVGTVHVTRPTTSLLRLSTDGAWRPWSVKDAADDYLPERALPGKSDSPSVQVMLAPQAPGADAPAVIAPVFGSRPVAPNFPLLRFNAHRQRWEVLPTPFSLIHSYNDFPTQASGLVMAPDGHGGFWLSARVSADARSSGATYFYHYTDLAPRPVFDDVPHPVREVITSAAGAADGSFWLTTDSDAVYRYDRVTGWDRFRIPGWDPGRVVTRISEAHAVALGPGGQGVVVGKAGRIADVGPAGGHLDEAAGTVCSATAPVAPCGTSRDLRAAAVAPDGSAMAGGSDRALLWRPADGHFASIAKPDTAPSATITGISFPRPDRAWLTTDAGQVFAGELSGGAWSWRLDDQNDYGDLLTRTSGRDTLALRAIALAADGRGFAVGDRGVVLSHTDDPAHPWQRLATGFLDNLTSVALSPGGGSGALIGGQYGLVLTLVGGRFEVARYGDDYDPLLNTVEPKVPGVQSAVSGLAAIPGPKPGQLEAWAALQVAPFTTNRSPAPNALLHYASDPSDPLLNPAERVSPLPDSPPRRPGELSFAAFGRSECRWAGSSSPCPETTGSGLANEVIAGRVTDELAAQAKAGALDFALFTGDVNDAAGRNTHQPATENATTPLDADAVHDRWVELVANRLQDAGLPLFGAIGRHDLSEAQACTALGTNGDCAGTADETDAGPNLQWRQAFAGMPAPWGQGPQAERGTLAFRPAEVGGTAVPGDGAKTHYAFDLVDTADGDKPLLRVAVVDTSRRSLAGSDPLQNPVEAEGGQSGWLESAICIKRSAEDTAGGCTRGPHEQALVLSTTPSYSYGPGAGSDTLTDSATFESLMFRHHVNAVVGGRVGWNALAWSFAPGGIHSPCPGGDYPQEAPADAASPCASATGTPDAVALAGALESRQLPEPPVAQAPDTGQNLAGVLPEVIAASAGGSFGPVGSRGSGPATNGYWHGYTVVRLDRSGDPRATIVEQRPILDWIGLRAQAHVVMPGQKLTLHGYGREAVGIDQPIRYDDISSPAITHRYSLVEADPDTPYLPRKDADGNYLVLDPSVASIDRESGKVTSGRSNHGRVYSLAILSVGDKAASVPLVFEPKRSYVAPRPQLIAPPPVPQVRVLGLGAQALAPPPSPPPPNTPPPFNTNLSLPSPPQLPTFPAATAPPIAPPAPPAPPPPPGAQQAVPLNLSVTPVGIAVPPTPGVTAQPTPPVQPAPPSGARREAKQRQAATAKSEEGMPREAQQLGGDLATGPDAPNSANAMSRRERVKPGPSFSSLGRTNAQPSAWVTGLEWGGSATLLALALAFAWVTVRPTPRRRPPAVPAPAWRRGAH